MTRLGKWIRHILYYCTAYASRFLLMKHDRLESITWLPLFETPFIHSIFLSNISGSRFSLLPSFFFYDKSDMQETKTTQASKSWERWIVFHTPRWWRLDSDVLRGGSLDLLSSLSIFPIFTRRSHYIALTGVESISPSRESHIYRPISLSRSDGNQYVINNLFNFHSGCNINRFSTVTSFHILLSSATVSHP